jgi:hypothetical protein
MIICAAARLNVQTAYLAKPSNECRSVHSKFSLAGHFCDRVEWSHAPLLPANADGRDAARRAAVRVGVAAAEPMAVPTKGERLHSGRSRTREGKSALHQPVARARGPTMTRFSLRDVFWPDAGGGTGVGDLHGILRRPGRGNPARQRRIPVLSGRRSGCLLRVLAGLQN